MDTFISILLIVACCIAFLLLLAFLMKKEHFAKREIIIHAPRQKIFEYIKLLKNQDTFNEGAMTEPDRKREFKGTDGTVGYIYAWSGDKAGEGEKEILAIEEGKRIEAEIRFVKPMKTSATIIMELESLPGDQTKVSWSNAGKLNYPINIMIPMLEKSVAKGMDRSLIKLKEILEK